MLEGVGRFNQLAEMSGTPRARPLALPFSAGRGFLGERQIEVIAPRPQRQWFSVTRRPWLPQVAAFLVSESVAVRQPFLVMGPEPFYKRTEQLIVQADVEHRVSSELQQLSGPLGLKRQSVPVEESDREKTIVPYLGLLRNLIETNRVPGARRLLEVLPLHIRDHSSIRKLRAVLALPTVKRMLKKDVDRGREYEWLRTEGHKYRGQWVALNENGLVASAPTLQELRDRLKTLMLPRRPLLHRVE